MSTETNHYFKNKEIVPILIEWQDKVREAKTLNMEPPQMPNKICLAIIQLASKICNRFNFRDYSYRDVMEADIIETVWKRGMGFDTSKSDNLFGYWSLIGERAAIQVIKKEKREQNKKIRLLREMDVEQLFDDETVDESQVQEFVEYIRGFGEETPEAKRPSSKKIAINKFDSILEGFE